MADLKSIDELRELATRVKAQKDVEEADRLFEEAKTVMTEAASNGRFMAMMKCDSQKTVRLLVPRLEALGFEVNEGVHCVFVWIPEGPSVKSKKRREKAIGCLKSLLVWTVVFVTIFLLAYSMGF